MDCEISAQQPPSSAGVELRCIFLSLGDHTGVWKGGTPHIDHVTVKPHVLLHQSFQFCVYFVGIISFGVLFLSLELVMIMAMMVIIISDSN